MPDLRSSSPAKRALAAELRRMRELTGMSADEVAKQLHWSASKISRIETNRTGVKGPDLHRLVDLYNADDSQRSQLTSLAAEPERRGWWNAFADSIDPEYAAYVSLEHHASQLHCWSPELIHGLLQTGEYAGEIMAVAFGDPPSISPRTIQDRIDIRLRRQDQIISSEHKRINFILDEAALLHQYGSATVMRRQLGHILDVSELPNTTVRIVPFSGLIRSSVPAPLPSSSSRQFITRRSATSSMSSSSLATSSSMRKQTRTSTGWHSSGCPT